MIKDRRETIVRNASIVEMRVFNFHLGRAFPDGRKEGLLGREGNLNELQAFLQNSQNDARGRKVIVIRGGFGVGKTQLCLNFAHKNREQ